MRTYELTFSDGKRCRCIVMDEAATEEADIQGITDNFKPFYLIKAERVVPPIPNRVSRRREGDCWMFGRFTMRKSEHEKGEFELKWPNGSTKGDKDHISRMIRENWRYGC